MAVYVKITKEREADDSFIYSYTAEDGTIGTLKLDKTEGASQPIEIASGDHKRRRYLLAARKLWKHFQLGEFPDETCWAS